MYTTAYKIPALGDKSHRVYHSLIIAADLISSNMKQACLQWIVNNWNCFRSSTKLYNHIWMDNWNNQIVNNNGSNALDMTTRLQTFKIIYNYNRLNKIVIIVFTLNYIIVPKAKISLFVYQLINPHQLRRRCSTRPHFQPYLNACPLLVVI